MLPEVKILNRVFTVFGICLMNGNGSMNNKLYSYILTGALIVVSVGIGIHTIRTYYDFSSIILPMTYFASCIFAIMKRWSLLHCKKDVQKLLFNFENSYEYRNENRLKTSRFSDAKICKIHNAITLFLMNLFFSAYVSPFSHTIFGKPLNYSVIMYPIYIPWQVTTLLNYMFTYLIQAVLVAPALVGIYTYTMFTVFVTINFEYEFKKICEAIETLESRVIKLCLESNEHKNRTCERANLTGLFYGEESDKIFKQNLHDCIEHYKVLRENFRIFGNWYTKFFSTELIESTTTICLLFFCIIKKSDLSLILNLLSLSSHLVASLFFRCFVGEYFTKMNEILSRKLYDISWYEQHHRTMKLILIFQSNIRRPFTFNGLKLFPASYRTFFSVGRISFSYCNVLLNS